jgi:hypothetical protein
MSIPPRRGTNNNIINETNLIFEAPGFLQTGKGIHMFLENAGEIFTFRIAFERLNIIL